MKLSAKARLQAERCGAAAKRFDAAVKRGIIQPAGRIIEIALKKAIGRDWKGKLSPMLYIAAILLAWRSAPVARAIFVVAALIWLIPDRRIENALPRKGS